jgi:phage baseplate assembly protein W
MSTRADRFTQIAKKQETFSDFLNNFDKTPVTSTLAKIVNEESIKQSLRNLILTNMGERLFQPLVGSNVNRSLFEPADSITADSLIYYIKNCIRQNEPRVLLNDVFVFANSDGNSFLVTIVFSVINNTAPISLDLILRRVR